MQHLVLQTWRTELAKVGGSQDVSGDAVNSDNLEHESKRIDAGALNTFFCHHRQHNDVLTVRLLLQVLGTRRSSRVHDILTPSRTQEAAIVPVGCT